LNDSSNTILPVGSIQKPAAGLFESGVDLGNHFLARLFRPDELDNCQTFRVSFGDIALSSFDKGLTEGLRDILSVCQNRTNVYLLDGQRIDLMASWLGMFP
jgi:hypothetical protein